MKRSDKTIKMTVYFWTDKMDDEQDSKKAWDSGMVAVQANPSKGIVAGKSVAFNSFDDLPAAIRKCAQEAGIDLLKWGAK